MFNEKVIFKQSKQLLNITILLIILFLVEVHFDISGNDINDTHPQKASHISALELS